MTSQHNYASDATQSQLEFELSLQKAAERYYARELAKAQQEAPAPKPTPPASLYRGALFAAIPSLCLWVPVGLVLAWGAFKLLSEFMALGSNFLR